MKFAPLIRLRSVTAVAAAFLGFLAGAVPAAAPARAEEAPIKIGLTTDLTGIAAAYARGQVNAVQLAIDEINSSGGLLGRKVELIVRDSQLKPDLGASHTRDLITREHVDFLIGPDASSVGVAVTGVAKQYKKVVMMTIPNTPRITGELFHPYMFTIVPSGIMLARALAEGLGPKYEKWAFIGGDYEASHQALQYFSQWLKKVNPKAEVVKEAWPKLGEQDFTPYITQLVAAKTDIVFSYLWGADLIAFIKQAKPYGFFERTKFVTLLFTDDLKALGDEMPDGIVGQMYSPFFGSDSEQMKQFIARYRAKYNDYPSDWVVLGYDGMRVLAEGIKKANSLDSDAVVKALEGIKYDGLQSTITFRQIDHQGSVPSFLGTTAKDPQYPYKILKDLQRIPAEKVWPTPEEITAQRSGQ